jgi:hypothetical protein
MPEPSESDRRKAAQLPPAVADARLVDCLAQGLDVRFQCQYCGMERTWTRQDFLGRRLRRRLAWTLARSQASVFCPQRGCGGHRPIVRLMKGGYHDDHADTPEGQRAHVVTMLLDAGVLPEEVGL